jgi:hypothetical protein
MKMVEGSFTLFESEHWGDGQSHLHAIGMLNSVFGGRGRAASLQAPSNKIHIMDVGASKQI